MCLCTNMHLRKDQVYHVVKTHSNFSFLCSLSEIHRGDRHVVSSIRRAIHINSSGVC